MSPRPQELAQGVEVAFRALEPWVESLRAPGTTSIKEPQLLRTEGVPHQNWLPPLSVLCLLVWRQCAIITNH